MQSYIDNYDHQQEVHTRLQKRNEAFLVFCSPLPPRASFVLIIINSRKASLDMLTSLCYSLRGFAWFQSFRGIFNEKYREKNFLNKECKVFKQFLFEQLFDNLVAKREFYLLI